MWPRRPRVVKWLAHTLEQGMPGCLGGMDSPPPQSQALPFTSLLNFYQCLHPSWPTPPVFLLLRVNESWVLLQILYYPGPVTHVGMGSREWKGGRYIVPAQDGGREPRAMNSFPSQDKKKSQEVLQMCRLLYLSCDLPASQQTPAIHRAQLSRARTWPFPLGGGQSDGIA